MSVDQALEQDFIRVTEEAAVAAAQTMGYGDQRRSDEVAVKAMRRALDRLEISGRIVIGKGKRGRTLRVGEEVGALKKGKGGRAVDVAVDPLEGTNLCAKGAAGAMSVVVAAERGGLLYAPESYMEKIVVGPTARGVVHLDAPVAENLRNVARSFRREVPDLTVVVLDRPRHRQLIADIRAAGARIRLIRDGDLSASIAAAVRGTGVHAVMGVGGAPEGVCTAAAMRCLGGEIQARLAPRAKGVVGDGERTEGGAVDVGSAPGARSEVEVNPGERPAICDASKTYTTRELAPGEQILFSCTGVTSGELLRGVRFFGGGYRTSTLFMSLSRQLIRFVDTIHREELSRPVHFR